MSELEPRARVLEEYSSNPFKREILSLFTTHISRVATVNKIVLVPDNYYGGDPRIYVVVDDRGKEESEAQIDEAYKQVCGDENSCKLLGPVAVAIHSELERDMFLFFRVIDESDLGVIWERQGRLL